jgi:glycosyltransferase involved in cell wall biosynthesis
MFTLGRRFRFHRERICPFTELTKKSNVIGREEGFMESSLVVAEAVPERVPHVLTGVTVSVVIPCLNEADTIESCIKKASRAMADSGISGEVVVADNGSTDGSLEIASRAGAQIVHVSSRGYGSALAAGIGAAKGEFILMGDADDSYDFSELPRFIRPLEDGYDLVQGCRLPSGGGNIMPGAMPLLHRWWGNPMFSWLARWWFGVPVHDIYCGMRAFRKTMFRRLGLRCTGMEFATEMIIRASLEGAKVAEVPTTLYPDGRLNRGPHLKTFQDGWRTLRLFLIYSPRWLFLFPGLFMIAAGLAGYAIAMPGLKIDGMTFDAHTLLFSSLSILCGYQAVAFGVLTKGYAVGARLLPRDRFTAHLLKSGNLEKGIAAGALGIVIGLVFLAVAINQWRVVDFGLLDYSRTMRWVIPGATLTALGVQTVLSSFFLAVLGFTNQ